MQTNLFLPSHDGSHDVKCTRNSLHFEVSCNNKYIVVLGMSLVYLLLFGVGVEWGGGGGRRRLGGTSQTGYFG